MRHILTIVGLGGLAVLGACQPAALQRPLDPPQRIESRIGGPERVFARPLAEIVPLLRDAAPAGPNGRVGPELVFWGYQLAGNRPAVLVACAVVPGVDCAARLPLVCAAGRHEVLFSAQEGGEVRYRNCQAIGIAQPGDLSPNCVETEEIQPVDVTLLACLTP